MRIRHLFLPLLVGTVACTDQPLTAPSTRLPSFDIADAARDYKSGFYWLPPMVRNPSVSGTFDAALSPIVNICELEAEACGPVIATYTTTTGPGGELVQVQPDDQQYHVNWHTNEFPLDISKIYRVSVRAGVFNTLLGYADVQLVSSGAALKNVDTDEYIGLKDGRTLPIKFRIETGIVGSVVVEPVDAEAAPGATQQFVATVRDLHGNLMSAPVTWASSDEAVATIDQTGLATAVANGVTTITATSERITGSATLTVESGVILVSVGNHACAVAASGKAYCWGSDGVGQLGNGSAPASLTPVAVVGGHTFVFIAAGTSGSGHTCGITTVGQSFCWGSDQQGQLGNGFQLFGNQDSPTPVVGGHTFTQMSLGQLHTCAVTTSHQAYCWGFDGDGMLGTNSSFNSEHAPKLVVGGHAFTSISVGTSHTCALTTAGAAYCWGLGADGRLGNGSTTTSLIPAPVAGGHTFASIDAGSQHTCAITTAGQAYCWGRGVNGTLGNGSTSNQAIPVAVAGGLTFASISAGTSTCAVTTVGQGFCWGAGQGGRLGNGSTENRLTPEPIAGGHTFVSISVGGIVACGVAVESGTDRTYCWGQGSALGSGVSPVFTQLTPAPVAPFPL